MSNLLSRIKKIESETKIHEEMSIGDMTLEQLQESVALKIERLGPMIAMATDDELASILVGSHMSVERFRALTTPSHDGVVRS